uniref:Retrotransposon Orf1 n=1 Tax=Tanacetum cinerariifolium TaxID=118510 RepID=A0A6L2N3Z7_TANCI|nr:retrotransposon Orf1 [Tanacetum cinerariifolium]
MVVEDISSIIDPRLSQVVLGKPFVEISNMTHDLSLRILKFTKGIDEISYKIPHKMEQFNSLSDFEKEHTKSVYFRNEEDKRRGVHYVILNFIKIKRYIDNKPNHELIYYCLEHPHYKLKWAERIILVAEGSLETTTEGYMENYKNVLEDIQNLLNAKAEVVHIILTGINNDIYSTADACPNAMEMWKAIERLNPDESINVQDLETNLYWESGKFTSQDGESLASYYLRFVTLVKQSQELKTVSYHKLYDILKQHQNEVNEIRAERLAQQVDWRDDTDNVPKYQELDAHYLYMERIQERTSWATRICYDTYLDEQGDINITTNLVDMSTNGEEADKDDDDLAREHALLASLTENLKYEIDDNKNNKKLLESSNKTLVDKLKSEIEDFKNKNKCL